MFLKYSRNSTFTNPGYLDGQLSWSAWPFGWVCLESYKTQFPWNYRL